MSPIAHPAPRRLASFAVASEPGSERAVLARVAQSVAGLGLTTAQVQRLRTAVGEATMNAIEHGNQNRPELPVEVGVFHTEDEVVVTISDHGGARDTVAADTGAADTGAADTGADSPEDKAEVPDLAMKLNGQQSPRGWGLFLIRHMIDAMDVTTDGQRHTVRLTMRTGPGADDDKESRWTSHG